ncbi:MAG: DUF2933 domain-containing protein [Thermoanaerobaculia bacterium]
MEWQTADWFFILIFVAFVAAIVFGFVRKGRGDRGSAESQRPSGAGEDQETPGPRISM